MSFSRLPAAWKNVALSKSRQKKGNTWLRWIDESDENQGEASNQTLKYNCPRVHCLVGALKTLDPVKIEPLMEAVAWLQAESFCWYE